MSLRVIDIETSSDSDDEYWDARGDDRSPEWWSAASNHASVNNSPVKAGSSSNLQNEPSTPVSHGLAETMQARLNMRSGGTRTEDSSPTKSTPNSVASGSQNPRRVVQTPPSFEKRTRSVDETAFSNAKTTPSSGSDKTAMRRANSVATPSAAKSARLASLNKAYEARKSKSGDSHLSRTGRAGPSGGDRTPSPFASSSKVAGARSRMKLPYESELDVEMDELAVEQMVATDTESSVPSTRQNSMLFSASASRTTSMTSVMTDLSAPSGSRSRKRSLEYQDELSSDSNPTTPPKMRRTTDGPQTRMGPPMLSPNLSRASTVPTPTTRQLYHNLSSDLPLDEPSVFRLSPAKSPAIDPLLPKPDGMSSTPNATSRRKVPRAASSTTPIPPSTRPHSPTSHDTMHQYATKNPIAVSDGPAPDFAFLDNSEGADLPLCIIAHDRDAQKCMDSMRISWGVQWEIARGVSRRWWKWSEVTVDKLNLLKGSNAEAAWKAAYVMKTGKVPSTSLGNLELWREMDREQNAILENRGRGLGLMGEWEGEPNWWGGRIQQILRLAKAPPGSAEPYVVYLERLESRRSHRIARLLGSRRVTQMRIDPKIVNKERDQLHDFLLQNFVLCGRIFRPFTSKDGKLYMMEPDLDYERTADPGFGDQYRISFADFINWHNPFHLNSDQPISKWSTRWTLGLSTSRPVLEFKEENIYDDRLLRDPEQKNVPTEMMFTDGCGFINGAALTAIWNSDIVKLPHRPVAVQGRIGGAKGMWVMHPDDQSSEPCLWNRPSQTKINLPTPLHRAHLIFDLLSPSRVSTPANLSMQTITCLAHNGVPDTAFKTLIETELDAIINPLTDWEGPNSMAAVAKAIERAGHITGVRLQRLAGGSMKALGLSRDFHRDEDDGEKYNDDAENFDDMEAQVSSGRDKFSEAPRSVFESAYELILAGFHPLHLKLLYDKVQKIVTFVIDNFVKNLHIPVSESVEAYIIPDPTGILEEGQIYFCSSQNLLDASTGKIFHVVTGPVIVGRNPTRLSSDLQMVEAIDCPELHGWYDVIIFSTKGKRSLASLLAGGDYDGDTAMMFWSKLLIEHFRNSTFCEPPVDLLTRNFHREIETVVKFSQRVSSQLSTAQLDLQKVLLLGLTDSKVGLYSGFHDNAVYKFGYASKEAVRMAYMFNTCLDSPKTGHRLKEHIFRGDQALYGCSRPSCMVPLDQADAAGQGYQSAAPVERSEHLGTFILDSLVTAGRELRIRHLQAYDRFLDRLVERPDMDLTRPFLEATAMAERMKKESYLRFSNELEAVKAHVNDVRARYQRFWATPRKPSSSGNKKGNNRKDLDAAASDIARQFAEGPPNSSNFVIQNLATIKASYAYTLSTNFAFSMAYRDLCTIKAIASQHVPTARLFAEVMSIGPSFLRVLGENSGEY